MSAVVKLNFEVYKNEHLFPILKMSVITNKI